MKSYKVERIVEELNRNGFDMTTWEFYQTTIIRILRKYGIKAGLNLHEYVELMDEIKDLCAENDVLEFFLGLFQFLQKLFG